MSNMVCMIGTGCLKKLLKVTSGLPHLALEAASLYSRGK
jgi:hypothetical protein